MGNENIESQKKNSKTKNAFWFLIVGLSEVLGTALLLLIGCSGTLPNLGNSPPPHIQISLVFGLAVAIIVQCFGHISGAHINPAVTMAALIFKLITLPAAGMYILAQFVGALLGYGVLMVMTPMEALYGVNASMNVTHAVCTTVPNLKVSTLQGFLAEFFGTAILIFVCCSVWDKRNSAKQDSVPIKFGLTIFLVALALGPFSGASLNPARSFAPAVFTGVWDKQWIYWVSPLLATLITSYFYKYILDRHNGSPESEVSEILLNQINSKVQNIEKISVEDIPAS